MAGSVDPKALAKVEAAFAGNANCDPEIHYRRKDGSEFWASVFISPVRDESGEVVQHFISLADLTAGKQSDLALREAVERYQIVSQATANVVWDWNLVQDTLWWSNGMLALFGYDVGEARSGSSSWTDHIHPSDRDRAGLPSGQC